MNAALAHRQGMQDTTLSVTNMTCKSCVNRITRAVSGLAGVDSIAFDLPGRRVRIRHAPELLANSLVERLTQAGYPSEVLSG